LRPRIAPQAARPFSTFRLDFPHSRENTSTVRARVLLSSSLCAAAWVAALSVGLQQFAATPQQLVLRFELTPSEIEIYKGAHTLIDWTPREIHQCPFLHKLRPAGSQEALEMVLERVGDTVAGQLRDFPRIACDEVILEALPGLGAYDLNGMREPTRYLKFRYIVIPQATFDIPAFDEYRTDLDGKPIDALRMRGLSMTSSKYASTSLYFSPADQSDSRFRYFGTERLRDRECHVVGFAQQPARARRIIRFRTQRETAGLLCQGLGWIDSETFQILRITVWLLAPRMDIGMSSQSSTVDFSPVKPIGIDRELWMPREVAVVLVFQGKPLRNTYRYSNYQLFRVESTIKPES